ncbi:hypothetical protein VPH35_128303 [Triticum aestivum]
MRVVMVGRRASAHSCFSRTSLHPSTAAGRIQIQDSRLEREDLVSPGSHAMECLDCKNLPAVCGVVEGSSCHVSVPMTTFYWFEAVRCYYHVIAPLFSTL